MVQEVRKKVKGLKGNEKSLEAEVLIMGKAVDLVSNQALIWDETVCHHTFPLYAKDTLR